MKKIIRNYIIIAIIVGLGIAIDLTTKSLATNQHFTLLSGIFSINFTWNTGAGFSILSGHTLFLTIFTAILVVGLICLIIFYKPKHTLFAVGIAFVLGGALGNLYDRIAFGAVRNFVSLDFIKFPIFNFADTMLTIGAILCCIWLVFCLPKKEKNKTNGK